MGGILEGKSAIITGAGHGVGLAVARRFKEAGARVMLADEDEEAVERESRELCPDRIRAVSFRCAMQSKLDINNLMAASIDAFERVDIVVNAASVAAPGGALELAEGDFDVAMGVNVKAAFLLTQLAARHMIKRGEELGIETGLGSIVNISATNSARVIPNRFALGVTMAALDQLTRAFAVSLADHGIRVNAVAPGGVAGRFGGTGAPEVRKAIIKRTPMGRLGEPTEIAEAAMFLASEQSSYVTGQILVADGGRGIYDLPLPESEEGED